MEAHHIHYSLCFSSWPLSWIVIKFSTEYLLFYVCETWCLTKEKKEYTLTVQKLSVQGTSELKTEEVTVQQGK